MLNKTYIRLIRDYSKDSYQKLLRPAEGQLRFPFLVPGSSSYHDSLWDWDSWLTDVAVRQIMLDQGDDDPEFLRCERGCIQNFLSHIEADGRIPIMVNHRTTIPVFDNDTKTNIHKPCLAQHAAFLVQQSNGEMDWLLPYMTQLQRFVDYYRENCFDAATGLYFWINDIAIGVDNDPCTFYRPDQSSASIFLNCLMYKELQAMEYLCILSGLASGRYGEAAEQLKDAINALMWDERNGFYYSVDLNLKPIEHNGGYHISTGSVAVAIMIVKIIDSVDDVLFGFIVDRIDITKWKLFGKLVNKGKYMPWFQLTFWTIPVSTILFFLMPKDSPDALKIGWFFVTYLLFDFSCTLTDVPMASMVTTLTDNPSERNNILTVKGIITVVAVVVLSMVVSALISESMGVSLKAIGISGALIFLLFMLPMVFKVKEYNTELKNIEQIGSQEKYTFKDMINCVLTNKYILIYFLAVVVSTVLQTRTALESFIGFYIFGDSMLTTYLMEKAQEPSIARQNRNKRTRAFLCVAFAHLQETSRI